MILNRCLLLTQRQTNDKTYRKAFRNSYRGRPSSLKKHDPGKEF